MVCTFRIVSVEMHNRRFSLDIQHLGRFPRSTNCEFASTIERFRSANRAKRGENSVRVTRNFLKAALHEDRICQSAASKGYKIPLNCEQFDSRTTELFLP